MVPRSYRWVLFFLIAFLSPLASVVSGGSLQVAPSDQAQPEIVYAAMAGNIGLVEQLIQEGADVNTKDRLGNTLLLLAIINKHPELAIRLVQKGADVQGRAMGPWWQHATALMRAIACTGVSAKDYQRLVASLLKAGADVNARDDGGTPLMWAGRAAGVTQSIQVFQMLLANGADATLKDKEGRM